MKNIEILFLPNQNDLGCSLIDTSGPFQRPCFIDRRHKNVDVRNGEKWECEIVHETFKAQFVNPISVTKRNSPRFFIKRFIIQDTYFEVTYDSLKVDPQMDQKGTKKSFPIENIVLWMRKNGYSKVSSIIDDLYGDKEAPYRKILSIIGISDVKVWPIEWDTEAKHVFVSFCSNLRHFIKDENYAKEAEKKIDILYKKQYLSMENAQKAIHRDIKLTTELLDKAFTTHEHMGWEVKSTLQITEKQKFLWKKAISPTYLNGGDDNKEFRLINIDGKEVMLEKTYETIHVI